MVTLAVLPGMLRTSLVVADLANPGNSSRAINLLVSQPGIVGLAVTEPFAGTELAAALCPACTDRQFLAGGGAILELRHELEKARFPLGKVTITGGAVD